jgi:hypothetical protein
VRTLVVVVLYVFAENSLELTAARISSQSRHSSRSVRTKRSACAFAFGALTGVRITWISSLRKTSSNAALNFFQWSVGGAEIAGATQSSITTSAPGDYSCRVTAENHAGSATQASAAHAVAATASPSLEAVPPDTKITKAKINAKKDVATFKFKASGQSTGFQCALARKHKKAKFKKCSSPKTYKKLKPGKYIFEVRAVGPGGTDPSPAMKKFKIA